MRTLRHFSTAAARNAAWKQYTSSEREGLRRTSSRNQVIDPRYLEDLPQASGPDLGLGNAYRGYCGNVYGIETKWSQS